MIQYARDVSNLAQVGDYWIPALEVESDWYEVSMAWYRAVLQCDEVPPALGAEGAKRITANFAKRNWHRNAMCSWDGKHLTLSVENDFDRDGRAVMDEFSDEISASICEGFDGDVRVISVTEINHEV